MGKGWAGRGKMGQRIFKSSLALRVPKIESSNIFFSKWMNRSILVTKKIKNL